MIKKLNVIVCFILVAFFSASVLNGCKSDKDITIIKNRSESLTGIHDYTAKEVPSQDYMVKNGVTEYKLVVPVNPSNSILIAVEEFNSLFKKATNLTLPYISDNNCKYDKNEKFISLGDTSLLKQAGVSYDKSILKYDGCRIITKDKSVFLLGASDDGVINAVYDFMKICFNYEFYYRDCIEIDKNISDLKLYDFDVTDVPDIAIRKSPHELYLLHDNSPHITDYYAFGEGAEVDAKNRARRYKYNQSSYGMLLPIYDKFNADGGYKAFHNAFNYVTKEQAKPGWLSLSGEQLCYSASSHTDHFDEENFNLLAEHCAKKIEDSLVKYPREIYPGYNTATLTQMDAAGFCTCPTCTAWKEKDNGAISGGMIRLNNAVMKKVKEWMDKPENQDYKRDNFKLLFFAYSLSEDAPVVYNDKLQVYEPANDEVIPRDDVGVYYAAIESFSYTRDIYNDINKQGRDILQKWKTLSDCVWLWTYGLFYKSNAYFCDVFSFFNADAYSFFAKNGVLCSWTETENTAIGATTWFRTLLIYLQSKLMWDASLDSGILIKKYFEAMYKDAADTMYEMFIDCRLHFAKLSEKEQKIKVGSIIRNKDYYTPDEFKTWISYTDQATLKIEKYKESDPKLYYLLKDRIEIEAVGPIYCLLDLYGGDRGTPPITYEERQGYIDRLLVFANVYPNFKGPESDFVKIIESWR